MKRLFLFALLFAACAAIPHLNAQNTGTDPAKIIEAAERGNAEAQNKLGELYAKGMVVSFVLLVRLSAEKFFKI